MNGNRGKLTAAVAVLALAAGCGGTSHDAGKPLSCHAQYEAWKNGPAKAEAKTLVADLQKVQSAASAQDILHLTSALKSAAADSSALERYPAPKCADPAGYWHQVLTGLQAASDNTQGSSGFQALLLAAAPLRKVYALLPKLSAEVARTTR